MLKIQYNLCKIHPKKFDIPLTEALNNKKN